MFFAFVMFFTQKKIFFLVEISKILEEEEKRLLYFNLIYLNWKFEQQRATKRERILLYKHQRALRKKKLLLLLLLDLEFY